MRLLQIRMPAAPNPYVHAAFDGVAFWFRGSVSYELDILDNPDVMFRNKMGALAVWLADEIPANRLVI